MEMGLVGPAGTGCLDSFASGGGVCPQTWTVHTISEPGMGGGLGWGKAGGALRDGQRRRVLSEALHRVQVVVQRADERLREQLLPLDGVHRTDALRPDPESPTRRLSAYHPPLEVGLVPQMICRNNRTKNSPNRWHEKETP